MTKKIKTSRRGSKSKNVTFSNLLGGKSDFYEPGKYPFNSAQFFKKSNITTVPLVKKQNVSKNLSSKNVKPVAPLVPVLKTNSKTNIKPVNSKSLNSKPVKTGGKSFQDPANAMFTSNALKTTKARGSTIDTDKFNRQWSVSKQYANYPMNAGIYASSMPAAKSNTGGRYKKSRKTKSKTKSKKSIGGNKRGRKLKSKKTQYKRH